MIIGGAMLLGLGIGLAIDAEGPGVLVGLGLGLLVEGIRGRSGNPPFGFGKSKPKE